MTGKTFPLVYDDNDTIDEVKTKISYNTGIPANQQQLMLDDEVLKDCFHIADIYHIADGVTIQLIVKPTITIHLYCHNDVSSDCAYHLDNVFLYDCDVGIVRDTVTTEIGAEFKAPIEMRFRGEKLLDGLLLSDYNIENNDVLYVSDGAGDEYGYVMRHDTNPIFFPVLVKVKQVEMDYDVVYLNNVDGLDDLRIIVDAKSQIDTIKKAVCEAFYKDFGGENIVDPATLTLYFRSTVMLNGTLADYGYNSEHDYLYVEGEEPVLNRKKKKRVLAKCVSIYIYIYINIVIIIAITITITIAIAIAIALPASPRLAETKPHHSCHHP